MNAIQSKEAETVDQVGQVYFVHINKTAGSSIEQALNIEHQHKTALVQREEVGVQQWEQSYSFSFVRNPWDKVVSQYYFKIKNGDKGLTDHWISFNEWVVEAYGKQNPIYVDRAKSFMPQLEWLVDDAGKVIVDFIGKFENLQADFAKVCTAIGKTVSLGHTNKTKHLHYSELYNEETKQIIAQVFEQDIAYFGYHFETK